MSKDNTRRKYAQMVGLSLGSIAIPKLASAKRRGQRKENGKGIGHIDTDFDPDDKVEVAEFARDLKNVNNLRAVYNQLTERQRTAVREMLQPTKVTIKAKEVTTEGQISISSSWQSATAVYTAYAEGQWPYNRLWEFTHEANWEYNGNEVRNVTSRHVVSTNHPLWHWRGLVDESMSVRNDNYISYKQGHFAYCEPLKVGCVGHDYPYIEITGDENGNHSAESNYQ